MMADIFVWVKVNLFRSVLLFCRPFRREAVRLYLSQVPEKIHRVFELIQTSRRAYDRQALHLWDVRQNLPPNFDVGHASSHLSWARDNLASRRERKYRIFLSFGLKSFNFPMHSLSDVWPYLIVIWYFALSTAANLCISSELKLADKLADENVICKSRSEVINFHIINIVIFLCDLWFILGLVPGAHSVHIQPCFICL